VLKCPQWLKNNMGIETEDKFLNKEYVETRLRDFKDIKSKNITFEIKGSDRIDSLSLYVEFFIDNMKLNTLRISDHLCKTSPHLQFIIEPTKILAKKKKELFVRTVNHCLAIAKSKKMKYTFRKIEK